MLTHTSRWSHARGNGVVPSRWQATPDLMATGKKVPYASLQGPGLPAVSRPANGAGGLLNTPGC